MTAHTRRMAFHLDDPELIDKPDRDPTDMTSGTYNPTLPAGLAWLSLERRT